MNLKPSEHLSRRQITSGLDLVIKEGLTSEAMTSLTGGTFLVAMALLLGASNFQIGILAALPAFTNVFQLVAIWLLQKYNNRRAIAVLCNGFARFPLLIIGLLPFLFTKSTSIEVLIFLLFFHYFFGSITGAIWNSWMKDLVPTRKLGSYFSQRTRMTQTLNVFLTLTLALLLDHIKKSNPGMELTSYAIMFISGGLLGLLGTYLLSKTPEPVSHLPKENFLKLFKKPLADNNFRNLLIFNAFWSFSLNIATPFFTVYMMRTLQLPLSYIICFAIAAQVASISAIKIWGKYSDKYSNKTIIKIAAPLYILCIVAWTFTGMLPAGLPVVVLIAAINIITGLATAGINLSIGNIGIKLAPKNEAIVYLSARSMVVASVSSLGPLAGGFLADYFSNRSFTWNIQWNGPNGSSVVHLFELHSLTFLFIIGGVLAIGALRLLRFVKEEGEISKDMAIAEIKTGFKGNLKKEAFFSLLCAPVSYPKILHKRIKNRIEHRVVHMRKWRQALGLRRSA